jgi:hypothetical protein
VIKTPRSVPLLCPRSLHFASLGCTDQSVSAGDSLFPGYSLRYVQGFTTFSRRSKTSFTLVCRIAGCKIMNDDKIKAVPLHAMMCLGERKYSSYSFLTSALGGSERSASRPGRALPRGKDPRYPLDRRLGGPQSRSGHRGYRKNPMPLPRIEP